ncbi:RNA-directed DNA polymerase, eukaryota [Tanacetum coccineum]
MELKLAAWNIRGMGTLDKQNEIQKLILENKISICAILETRAKGKEVERICSKIFNNWNWCTNMNKCSKGCRIALGWDSKVVNVNVIYYTWQVMFCVIESVTGKTKFFCSFVYAANHGKERIDLWKDLESQAQFVNRRPWILLGDFLCLLHSYVTSAWNSGFQFTWSKSPSNPAQSILKKLDRVMSNEEFINVFDQAHAVFLPYLISDHCPALVIMPGGVERKRKAFRFANYIVDKPDFLSTAAQEWKLSMEGLKWQRSLLTYAKAVLGNKSVDMSGKYGTSNAGAESVGVSDCNKVYKEAGNEAVMSISVDDCIDLDGKERSILAKVKDLSVISELLKHMSLVRGFDDVGLRYVGGRWVWLEFDSMDQVKNERCVWIDLVGLPLASWAPEVYKKLGGRWGSSVFTDMFAYWAPNIESMEVNSESNPLERKDAEGPSLDESLENEEHLDVDSCFVRGGCSWGGIVILVASFEEGEIRDDSVLYNDGCIKDCMEKNLEDDAGEILGVHSQGDCGNVTTDDNEDVTQVIAPEKDSIIAPPSTPPGNDLNIAVESGSSWIDYIGP